MGGPSRNLATAVVRLTLLLACVALAVSRFGLVAHEYLGHGGVALARGGSITEVKLFWFAGGWIRYDVPGATRADFLWISLGGIACELALAAVLAGAAWRRGGFGWALVRAIGATFAVHALWYLATGVWHGYGDGHLIHAAMGEARYPLAVAAGAGALGAAWLGARAIAGRLFGALPRSRVAGLVAAAAIAGGINVALDLGELHLRHDEIYAATMQPERERAIDRELAAWLAAQQRAHVDVTAAARAQQRGALARAQPKEFPFAIALAIGLLVTVVLASARAPIVAGEVRWRAVGLAAAVAAAGLALVIAIGSA